MSERSERRPSGGERDVQSERSDRRSSGGERDVQSERSERRPSDPVISPEHYRATLGHFCSGVTVVTAVATDGPAGMTCQSFCALSLDPPLILVCPGKSSTSWPRIESAGAFCVNVLAEDQEELCRTFATKGTDKFAGVGWSPGPFTGAPVLAGGLAWMECRMEQLHDAGDHVIVVGRVLDLQSRDGRPLLFYRGGYGRFEV